MMRRIVRHNICIFWAVLTLWMNSQAQPAWTVTTDTYQQTFVIGTEIFATDSMISLEEGDILGAFYTDERNVQCGGKMTWGTDNAMTFYNNNLIDSKTQISNIVYFKVWKKSQNCILDSVKGEFRLLADTSAIANATDTLNIRYLAGHPFRAGFAETEYCYYEGRIFPKAIPDGYNVTFTSDKFLVNNVTGEINLDGSYSGILNIRFSSDYCLAESEQTITVLPPPAVSFPEEPRICENIDPKVVLNEYIKYETSGSDSLEISEISRIDSISGMTYDYRVVLKDRHECEATQTVRVIRLPKPNIKELVEEEDFCDSVRIRLENNAGGTTEWFGNMRQDEVYLTSDRTVPVKYTDSNGCYDSVLLDTVRVRKMAITRLEPEAVNADCYTPGKVNLRNIELVNYDSSYDVKVKNLITGEETLTEDGLLYLKEGRYNVTAVDKRTCEASWDKDLIVLKDCLNDNPVFSPNSDGRDDDFYISYEGMVYIYNKNGRLIRRFQGPSYWDGTDESGNKLPLGIYLLVTGKEAKTITILR